MPKAFQETLCVSFQDAQASFQAQSAFQAKPRLRNPSMKGTTLMTNNIIADLSMDFSVFIVTLCAHPKGRQLDKLDLLLAAGVEGLEVHHPDLTPEERERALGLCLEKGLFVSGGSAFLPQHRSKWKRWRSFVRSKSIEREKEKRPHRENGAAL